MTVRVVGKEAVEGREALDQPFAVVETVHAEHQAPVRHGGNHPLDHRGALAVGGLGHDGIDVHPDREDARTNAVSINLHHAGLAHSLASPDVLDRVTEAVQVVLGLEAHDVIGAEVAQEFGMHGKGAQHLVVRERYVQEETQRLAQAVLPQHPSQGNQVVVMDPDQVARFEYPFEPLREETIRLQVGVVGRVVVVESLDKIMKQWPQHAVGKAVIVRIKDRPRQVDGRERRTLSTRQLHLCGLIVDQFATPAEPQPAPGLDGRQQAHCEAARRRELARDRDPVRNSHQPCAHSASSQLRLSRIAQSTIPTML